MFTTLRVDSIALKNCQIIQINGPPASHTPNSAVEGVCIVVRH